MKETTNNQSDSVAIPTLEANLGKTKLEVPHEHYAVGFFQKHCWEFLPAEVVGLGPHPQEDSQVQFENLQQKHFTFARNNCHEAICWCLTSISFLGVFLMRSTAFFAK